MNLADTAAVVQRLSHGRHRVEVGSTDRTIAALKRDIDRGYVHLRFTASETTINFGVPLDRERTVLTPHFASGAGRITLVGELFLDEEFRVRCVAEITLPGLTGDGWLERLDDV